MNQLNALSNRVEYYDPAQITDDAVTWYDKGGNNNYLNTYNRQTGTFSGHYNYGSAPLPCVRPPGTPF
jgi:hypothetical protein